MQNEAIAKLIKEFKALSISEREKFIDFISANSSPSDFKFIVDTKLSNGLVCPHCGAKGKGVCKNGVHSNSRPRFICKHCGKQFSVTTNGILYYSKKDFSMWKEFISCFLHGFSVRKSAEICGINKNTAFLWRHKVCDSLVGIMNGVTMSGIVEADETYFRVSYKGNRQAFKNGSVDRKKRKRGTSILHKNRKRGLSREQVCVPCAINRSGLSVSKISGLGKASYNGISAVIASHISKGSILCADGATAYDSLASKNGLERVEVNQFGLYNIQRMNSYHSRLKGFVDRFNGVSTKHLNNYLVYNNFANHAKETYSEKVRILTNHICSVRCFTKRTKVSDRPMIPVLDMAA